MNPQHPTAFISYGHEDYPAASRLYDNLRQAGVDAWLDKKVLLPGQRWQNEIRKAIRDSRYFIAVLSSRSTERRGYVHTEMRQALDVLDEFPEDDIFVIPIRLDECKLAHEKLRGLHYVDLFPSWEEGFARVLLAMGAAGSPATDVPPLRAGPGRPPVAPLAADLTELRQSLAELDRIIHDAEIDQNIAGVQARFLRWKERTARWIKQGLGEARATAFSSITAPGFIGGPQPRLMSEGRQCRSHLTALLGPSAKG